MTNQVPWEQRQAELKKAAIVEVLNAVTSGESLESAARRISRAYNRKRLPEGRRLRLSFSTLKRLWYEWKKDPRDSVFDLHYVPNNLSVIRPWISHLLTDYAIHHGLNIPKAYEALKAIDPNLPFVSVTMRRRLSNADQKRIAKAVQLRKRKNALDKELKTLTGGAKK